MSFLFLICLFFVYSLLLVCFFSISCFLLAFCSILLSCFASSFLYSFLLHCFFIVFFNSSLLLPSFFSAVFFFVLFLFVSCSFHCCFLLLYCFYFLSGLLNIQAMCTGHHRDGSTQASVHAATLRQKLPIILGTSPSPHTFLFCFLFVTLDS